MATIKLKLYHNTYTVETRLSRIDGDVEIPIREDSSLAVILFDRLSRWIAPHDEWEGFFSKIKNFYGSSRFVIDFIGTQEDFELLREARERYAHPAGITVDLNYLPGAEAREHNTGRYKMQRIRQMHKDIQNGSETMFRSPEILEIFDNTLNDEFPVGVTAPINSGKSTLQNAMIGKRNLPTSSEAKTATITYTKINRDKDSFSVRTYDKDGNWQDYPDAVVNQDMVEQLNDEIYPGCPDGKQAKWEKICLEGPVFRAPSDQSRRFDESDLQLVLIDTPGNNNATNEEHNKITQQLLDSDSNSMVLFVFSAQTLQYKDTRESLTKAISSIADSIRMSDNQKISRDRFLFVCNHADEIDEPYPKFYQTVKDILKDSGIEDPNLFLTCAFAAEAIRADQRNRYFYEQNRMEELDGFTERDGELMDSLIKLLSTDHSAPAAASGGYTRVQKITNPDKALYHFSSLPDAVKKQFDDQVAAIRAANPDAKVWPEVALIHSGVPALEYTIAEYIDRYAIPMKIQQLHDNLTSRIEELKMLETATASWAASDEALKKAQKELESKVKILKDSKKVKPYLEELDKIGFDRDYLIYKHSTLRQQLAGKAKLNSEDFVTKEKYINGTKTEYQAIPRARMDNYVEKQIAQIRLNYDKICNEITSYLENEIITKCNNIEEKFRKYVESLAEDGLFDLAGLRIDQLQDTKTVIQDPKLNPVIDKKREKTGTKKVKKHNPVSFVRRIFGTDSMKDYKYVAVYGKVEYVDVQNLYEDMLAPYYTQFDNGIKKAIDETEKEFKYAKDTTQKNLETLNGYIKAALTDWHQKLNSKLTIQEETKKYRLALDQTQRLVDELSTLLDIEV